VHGLDRRREELSPHRVDRAGPAGLEQRTTAGVGGVFDGDHVFGPEFPQIGGFVDHAVDGDDGIADARQDAHRDATDPARGPADQDVAPTLRNQFHEPEHGPLVAEEDLHPGGAVRTIRRDITTGETVYATSLDADEDGNPALTKIHPIDLEVGHSVFEEFRISEHDPLSAHAEVVHKTVTRRGDWVVRVDSGTTMQATPDAFHLDAWLEAKEGGRLVFSKRWERSVPRSGV